MRRKRLATFVCLLILIARCNAQDMPLTQVLIDGEGWEQVAEGYRFTEGPAVNNKGEVFFTDIPNSKIFKVDLQGKVTLFADKTARTNGLMFGHDGLLYGCRNGDKQIVAYKPDGSYDVVVRNVTCNDLVVNSRGEIYFTDPPNNRVYYVGKDKKARIVASGFRPNGVILWEDEGTLVVTDSDAPHLWAFHVKQDGSLSHGERYYGPLVLLPGAKRPGSDGMTVDRRGRLYVTTRAGLHMFDPTGRLGGVIANPQRKGISNVVLGGPKFDVLFVTSHDKVFRRKVKVQGAPYFLRAKE